MTNFPQFAPTNANVGLSYVIDLQWFGLMVKDLQGRTFLHLNLARLPVPPPGHRMGDLETHQIANCGTLEVVRIATHFSRLARLIPSDSGLLLGLLPSPAHGTFLPECGETGRVRTACSVCQPADMRSRQSNERRARVYQRQCARGVRHVDRRFARHPKHGTADGPSLPQSVSRLGYACTRKLRLAFASYLVQLYQILVDQNDAPLYTITCGL